MGEKMVSILHDYMCFTQKEETQWQQEQDGKTWKLFEVVGDLGESFQQELLPKLSGSALSRWAPVLY